MKGLYQGVQANILVINPRASNVQCCSSNLNLLLQDISKSSIKPIYHYRGLEKNIFAILTQHCYA